MTHVTPVAVAATGWNRGRLRHVAPCVPTIVVAVVAACLALAGCGAAGSDAPTVHPGPGTVTGPSSSGPSEDLPVPPGRTSGKQGGGRLTLTGTASPGVEHGCLLLQGYLLVGGPRDLLASGRPVTVTGRVQPDLVTTCQQGTPLLVESAEPG